MLELSGAYNDWAIGMEQLNGGGVNWWIDTLPVEAGEVFRPLVEPPGYFDDVDLCLGFENRDRLLPREPHEITLPAEGRSVALPFEHRAFVVKEAA